MFDYIKKLLNLDAFQSYITVAIAAQGGLIWLLSKAGCVADAAGVFNCTASTAPTWLLPYLPIGITILAILKVVISFTQGKVIAKTAVISSTGAAGTVTQKQVDSVSKPDAVKKTV
jgi:hypothetical protein